MIIRPFMSWPLPKPILRCYGVHPGSCSVPLSAWPCCFDPEVPTQWSAQLLRSYLFRRSPFCHSWVSVNVTLRKFFCFLFSPSCFFCAKALLLFTFFFFFSHWSTGLWLLFRLLRFLGWLPAI